MTLHKVSSHKTPGKISLSYTRSIKMHGLFHIIPTIKVDMLIQVDLPSNLKVSLMKIKED